MLFEMGRNVWIGKILHFGFNILSRRLNIDGNELSFKQTGSYPSHVLCIHVLDFLFCFNSKCLCCQFTQKHLVNLSSAIRSS